MFFVLHAANIKSNFLFSTSFLISIYFSFWFDYFQKIDLSDLDLENPKTNLLVESHSYHKVTVQNIIFRFGPLQIAFKSLTKMSNSYHHLAFIVLIFFNNVNQRASNNNAICSRLNHSLSILEVLIPKPTALNVSCMKKQLLLNGISIRRCIFQIYFSNTVIAKTDTI